MSASVGRIQLELYQEQGKLYGRVYNAMPYGQVLEFHPSRITVDTGRDYYDCDSKSWVGCTPGDKIACHVQTRVIKSLAKRRFNLVYCSQRWYLHITAKVIDQRSPISCMDMY